MTKNFENSLFVVATPIGNKSDFSERAIETLKDVDIIACEDCRTSAPLLEHYGINTKTISYHKFNEKQRTQEFVDQIKSGKKIALISDAGTPCISDPGRVLVKELFENGIKSTPIPGACAVSSFLSVIPRETEEFAFVGFLPRIKNQQQKVLDKFKTTDLVFYESANRLLETLKNIESFRGEAIVAIGRELTKKFEEIQVGKINEIIDYYTNNTLKGEIVCVIYGEKQIDENEIELIDKIKKLKELKYTDKDISKILSSLYDINKNQIYKLALNL